MLHVMAREEMALDFKGDLELEDAESGERRIVNGQVEADRYAAALQEFVARCREGARRDNIDHAFMTTSTPPQRALREYLLGRERGEAAGQRPRAS
jgi:hypothetical protein